jgi:hypothetical protein
MATLTKRVCEPVHTRSGSPAYVRSYPEAAAQTFKRGEFVTLTAGKVTLCGANPALIQGVAAQDATGVTDTPIKVYEANSDSVFVASLIGTGVITDVGVRYGVVRDATTQSWGIDRSNTTAANLRAVVVALDGRDTLGDVNTRCHFTFLETFVQTGRLTAASAQLI